MGIGRQAKRSVGQRKDHPAVCPVQKIKMIGPHRHADAHRARCRVDHGDTERARLRILRQKRFDLLARFCIGGPHAAING